MTFDGLPILEESTTTLACKLTDDEVLAKSRALSKVLLDIADAEDDQAEKKRDMKDEMANLVSSARAVSRVISAGEEYRPVVVRQYADYEDGTVKFVRLDTNEVMSVRTMTEDERQVPLSLALDAPAPEPAA